MWIKRDPMSENQNQTVGALGKAKISHFGMSPWHGTLTGTRRGTEREDKNFTQIFTFIWFTKICIGDFS